MIVHYDTCRRCFVLQRCLIESFKYLRYLDIVYGLQISRCFRFLNKEIKCLNRRKTYSAGCSPSFVYVRANCTGECVLFRAILFRFVRCTLVHSQ